MQGLDGERCGDDRSECDRTRLALSAPISSRNTAIRGCPLLISYEMRFLSCFRSHTGSRLSLVSFVPRPVYVRRDGTPILSMILRSRRRTGGRWLSGRLLDVYLPFCIQRVRDVDSDTGELRELQLPGQAEPCSMQNQPAIAVEVKPLVADIAFRVPPVFPTPPFRPCRDAAVSPARSGPPFHLGLSPPRRDVASRDGSS